MTYLKILKDLIAINSSFERSNKEIVDYVVSLLKKNLSQNRYSQKIQPIKKGGFFVYNLVIKIKGKRKNKPLIFSGHTDTVCPGEQWTQNPFRPLVKNGKIYGLGASDMKGALALMVYQLINLKQVPNRDIYLTLTADEEDEGLGMKAMEKYLQKLRIRKARIVIGESTSGKLRLGQKAVLGFRISLSSKTVHAATLSLEKNLKQNPLQRLLKIISSLNQLAQELNKSHPVYGGLTFNVGKILGGSSSNVVPSSAVAEVEFRFPPLDVFQNQKK